MYYVYVLQSEKDHRFYTGFSANLKGRFEEHKRGKVASTKKRLPVHLVYYEACLDERDARHREHYLKTYHDSSYVIASNRI